MQQVPSKERTWEGPLRLLVRVACAESGVAAGRPEGLEFWNKARAGKRPVRVHRRPPSLPQPPGARNPLSSGSRNSRFPHLNHRLAIQVVRKTGPAAPRPP